MIKSRSFITWQPVLTDHQAFTYQALSKISGVPVIAYVEAIEDMVRRSQGWTDTKVTSIERRQIPQQGYMYYCYQQLKKYRNDVHIFASPFQSPRLMLCMFLAALFRIEFYLISEPYSPVIEGYLKNTTRLLGKVKATLRPLLYRLYVRLLKHRMAGIFTISKLAYTQYQKSGMPITKLFPFGYFIPIDSELSRLKNVTKFSDGRALNIIFIGALIRRKGIDLLQAAVQKVVESGGVLSVDIFGPGEASLVPINNPHFCYKGIIPFGQAQKIISTYDLLVLPSRYDGWGVVVNEALCAGVPVVCSDMTGAGAVAVEFGAGLSFFSEDISSLSDVLALLAGQPALMSTMRSAALTLASALQPEIAAAYMLNVIVAPVEFKTSVSNPWVRKQV